MPSERARQSGGGGPRGPKHAAFSALYRERWPTVLAAAYAVLRLDMDAEDAAESVFVRLWKNGGWWDIKNPEAYFRRAGAQEALDLLRRRRDRLPLKELGEILAGRAVDPLEMVQRDVLWVRLEAELDGFPEQCGRICRMKWLEDFSHREVAARLGTTYGAVEKQVARGKRLLEESGFRRWLSSFVDGGGEAASPSIWSRGWFGGHG